MTLEENTRRLDVVEQLTASIAAGAGNALAELALLRIAADGSDELVRRSFERVERSSRVESAAASIGVEFVEELQSLLGIG